MLKVLLKSLKWITISLVVLVVTLSILIWNITFHPPALQEEVVVNQTNTPILESGQSVKILSWNVQYMSGKNYEFWYDRLDGDGPDIRASKADIDQTFNQIAQLIIEKNPDIILLQELHDNAKRTDYEDQLERLLSLLPPEYNNHSESFYWQAGFVPLPQIMGSVGMKLAVISKYKLGNALRHQLATIKTDPISDQFNFRRAIQEVSLPINNGSQLTLMNTHFDAFAQGSNTMQQQVAYLEKLLTDKTAKGQPWMIAGDLNLLPPGQYENMDATARSYYQPKSELTGIYQQFNVIPSLEQANGANAKEWFTHFPNRLEVTAPDRTIDYFVHSDQLQVEDAKVLQKNTWHISDHLPMIVTIAIP
ncbi:endonuclease/exonuclease/phosphatase family protein [Candidatus Njordibacter sp. Uisw_002]|uniref:endonuclease/exonuclease/phosphatase family protein n=1 Tax=Candidatus Njordibacter sp. Uisw_002 TaxID=3230971 RepID=UPI003D3BD8A3